VNSGWRRAFRNTATPRRPYPGRRRNGSGPIVSARRYPITTQSIACRQQSRLGEQLAQHPVLAAKVAGPLDLGWAWQFLISDTIGFPNIGPPNQRSRAMIDQMFDGTSGGGSGLDPRDVGRADHGMRIGRSRAEERPAYEISVDDVTGLAVLPHVPRYAHPVTGRVKVTEACGQLAVALRSGDDAAARSLAERSGIPAVMLTEWKLDPCGTVGLDAAARALDCIAALADGIRAPGEWLTSPDVIGMVADSAELVATGDEEHPWLRGIMALDPEDCPGVRELLLARVEEGSGRSDEARLLVRSCLRVAPGLRPAVRDAMEYELCAGDWARAFELASSLGDEPIAVPLLRPLDRLREPAQGAERAGRNQPCSCGSGRKYKACCRAKDLDGGTHPLTLRAPALYAMLATYAQRAKCRPVIRRISACAIGAPQAAMLALDLAIFDGGIAGRFLASRGHQLRPDERDLLDDWLSRPADMYEVTKVSYGSELTLRSLVGGQSRLRQRDRLFSTSVRRLDVVIGRLLPDGDLLPNGEKYVRALGGMAILLRDLRESAQELFPDGPVQPGGDPEFPVRLISQFAQRSQPTFRNGDGDEYRFCETTIEVPEAGYVWGHLTSLCIRPPEPPIRDLHGYDAYLAELPSRFWVRNSDTEIEYVGQVDPGRLTNLGTVRRTHRGFMLTANSVRRAAGLTDIVLDASTAAGRPGKVTGQSSKTADELTGDSSQPDDAQDRRAAMCRRLGVDAALTAAPPRTLILEEYFLPFDLPADNKIPTEINRELSVRSMLAAKNYDGRTPAEAMAAGGAARDRVIAMVNDCEWRLERTEAEGGDTTFMPRPEELRRRLGIR
jgi:hypothetical protein